MVLEGIRPYLTHCTVAACAEKAATRREENCKATHLVIHQQFHKALQGLTYMPWQK